MVVWWWVEKMRSLHCRFLYPLWGMMPTKVGEVPMEQYIPVQDNMLPKPGFTPVPLGVHGGRIEFAQRRRASTAERPCQLQ